MELKINQTWNGRAAVLACAAVLGAASVSLSTVDAHAGEVMNDRCSSRVAIPTTGYGEKPDAPGTIILVPPASGYTNWTAPFTVQKGSRGHIRWWCNSTIGNWADLGTYRFKFDLPKGLRCAAQIGASVVAGDEVKPEDLRCVADAIKVKAGASAYNGWTPERSRCSNRSNYIRARMGPNSRLQIECLGRVAGKVSPLKNSTPSFVTSTPRSNQYRPVQRYNWGSNYGRYQWLLRRSR